MTASTPDPACLTVTLRQDEHGSVWILVHGEADIATLRDLEVALNSIQLDGAQAVHLNLAELDSCDVASLRQLTTFVKTLEHDGRRVITHGASAQFRKVADLMGATTDLGLSAEDPSG